MDLLDVRQHLQCNEIVDVEMSRTGGLIPIIKI